MTFNKLVEEIKSLPLDLKEELMTLLERYLIEERRREIRKSHLQARKEHQAGKLKGSSKIAELKKMLA